MFSSFYFGLGIVTHFTGFDLTPEMLNQAELKKHNRFPMILLQADATRLLGVADSKYDWYISTYMFCVLPPNIVAEAVGQIARVLKPGGHFRIVEIVASKNETKKMEQLEGIAKGGYERYGLSIENDTLGALESHPALRVLKVAYLRLDTFVLIEGMKLPISDNK